MNALVALPLVASPAVAGYESSLNIDAELIGLGREIERAYAEYQPLRKQVAAMAEIVGEAHARRMNGPTAVEACRAQIDLWEELGFAPYNDRLNDITEETDAACRAIMGATPTTILGLAIKARCAAFSELHLWDEPFEDLDWQEKHYRSLVEATCAVAGFPAPDQSMTIAAYDDLALRAVAVPVHATLQDRAA